MKATFGPILLLAVAMLAATASSCAGDDSVAPGVVTATADPGSGTVVGAQPTSRPATPSPKPSDTPEPALTSTPTPEPTPVELSFTQVTGVSGTKTARSTGPLGIIYADAQFGSDQAKNRVLAFAQVNVGINERPAASSWMWNAFRAPGEGTTPITAQISTDVTWKGVLAGNGAGGTRAAVTITFSVIEGATTLVSEVVHSLEQRESVLTIGGFDDRGSEPVDLEVSLVPGRSYELRLTLKCEASSGLIGLPTFCSFASDPVFGDGYVTWGARTILFAP